MDTIMDKDTPKPPTAPRTPRRYSAQFKSDLVAACQLPSASVSAIASKHGMNPNVLHRWLQEHRQHARHTPANGFIALDISALQTAPAPQATPQHSIELRYQRAHTTLTVLWPVSAAAQCASLLREVLR